MVNKNELPITPKTEMQVLAFAIQELALYLEEFIKTLQK